MILTPSSTLLNDTTSIARMGPLWVPNTFAGPEIEMMACRTGATLGSSLSMTPVYDVSGPDAVKLLNYVCVNRDFAKLKINGSRHAIICSPKGNMMADGVIVKMDENTFRSYWLAPVLAYYVVSSGLDVEGKYIRDEFFLQLDGPRSLEILEEACQCDFHDLKFAQRKTVEIQGMSMHVQRLGMSGALAYELHGAITDAEAIWDILKEAGKDKGLQQLGQRHYCMNHTQGGYPNQGIHFQYAFKEAGEGLLKYLETDPYLFSFYGFGGSYSDEDVFVSPFDVGWDYLINYDHDFIGKEALQAIAETDHRIPVTLEWNPEDIADTFISWFLGTDVQPYDNIDACWDGADGEFRFERVLLDGELIGMTSGRIRDYYHRKMISLGFIRKSVVELGKEVTVLFGSPGHRQREIRATIAEFPYYNGEFRNETCDVSKIPKRF